MLASSSTSGSFTTALKQTTLKKYKRGIEESAPSCSPKILPKSHTLQCTVLLKFAYAVEILDVVGVIVVL